MIDGWKEEPAAYRICVQGRLEADWSDWLGGLDISVETGCDGEAITWLSGPIADQARLRGILCRLWDLNLALLSLARIRTEVTSAPER